MADFLESDHTRFDPLASTIIMNSADHAAERRPQESILGETDATSGGAHRSAVGAGLYNQVGSPHSTDRPLNVTGSRPMSTTGESSPYDFLMEATPLYSTDLYDSDAGKLEAEQNLVNLSREEGESGRRLGLPTDNENLVTIAETARESDEEDQPFSRSEQEETDSLEKLELLGSSPSANLMATSVDSLENRPGTHPGPMISSAEFDRDSLGGGDNTTNRDNSDWSSPSPSAPPAHELLLDEESSSARPLFTNPLAEQYERDIVSQLAAAATTSSSEPSGWTLVSESDDVSNNAMADQEQPLLDFEEEQQVAPPPRIEPDPVVVSSTEKVVTTPAESSACPFTTFSVWFNPSRLDARVADLIYWRDVRKTGVVFGTTLVTLLALTYLSLISVVSYLLLLVLIGTISFRAYRGVMSAVQKNNDSHPFKPYLELDLSIPRDKLQRFVDVGVNHLESGIINLRHVILVEDIFDSLRYLFGVYVLTYVGAWFNGLTLVILAFVSVFTVPKVYETYQPQIDQYLSLACTQVHDVVEKVRSKIPILKKKQS